MEVKLDENLPAALADSLAQFGHDVDSVLSEGLRGEHDSKVWAAAQEAGRFLITQDLDFSDIRLYAPGTHAGILLIRLSMPGRAALMERVTTIFRDESVESWRGCFVIATDRKIRVRRPDE